MNGFIATAQTHASTIDTIFSTYISDVQVAAAYFRDGFPLPQQQFNIPASAKPYPAYFSGQLFVDATHSTAVDPTLPPAPPIAAYPTYSAFFNPNILSQSDLTTYQATNESRSLTPLDNVYRALAIAQTRVQAVQVGLEDNTWQIYPLVYNITRFDPRSQNVCDSSTPNVPTELLNQAGYYARCRPWYTVAKRVAAIDPATRAASLKTGLGPVTFSAPYLSKASGKVLITASAALFNATALVGVIGVQAQMNDLNNRLSQVSVLQNGYIFIIDSDGYVVSYPQNLTSLNIYTQTLPISSILFANNTDLAATFLKLVLAAAADGLTRNFYNAPGGPQYTLAASRISTAGYYVVAIAPSSDISALSSKMHSSTNAFLTAALALTLVVLLLALLLALFLTRRVSAAVLKPVAELSGWLSNVRANPDAEVGQLDATSRELREVQRNFADLLIAIRFGNELYHAGDLQKALRNYDRAEAMMIRLRNERGRGVCLNNKGSVYKQLRELELSLDCFNRAIEISENLLAAANNQDEAAKDARRLLIISLANRKSNLAVLYKDFDNASLSDNSVGVPQGKQTLTSAQRRAEDLFLESLRLYRSVDHLQGIAECSGNLGQLRLETGYVDEAAELISDAYDIVRDKGDPVAMQHACTNMGILAEALGKPNEALTWFTYVLQRFEVVVRPLQRLCCSRVVALCETSAPQGCGRPDVARRFRALAEEIFGHLEVQGGGGGHLGGSGRLRDWSFVLDCSGSMSGSYIRACRSSLKFIIESVCHDRDRVGLTTFQTSAREVFGLTVRGEKDALSMMMTKVENDTTCDRSTAFYDAVLQAVRAITRGKGQEDGRERWIVALTDGEDNSSRPNSHSDLMRELKANPGLGLIVITVGELSNRGKIDDMVKCVADGRGLVFTADKSGDGIREAFSRAVKVISGNMILENL
ncbi:hypothetical protein HK101_009715 [Irineochytrium annulatum]|nr:hypothetical protein HK101_009715 [Irineochytrium annulatum]